MSKPPRKPPAYRKNTNGQAFVECKALIPEGTHRLSLGVYGSPKSREEYRRFIAEWERAQDSESPPILTRNPTISSLVSLYEKHAASYYSEAGKPTKQYHSMMRALWRLTDLLGTLPASEFGPKRLGKFRDELISRGYTRVGVNQQLSRVKRFIGWCVSEEMIDGSILHALQSVKGLRKGRSNAIETEPISPVTRNVVEATLPFLSPTVRAMVEVQYICGMRPQDVCRMRGVDIDLSRDIWIYRPPQHKNAWRGATLAKAIPKVAQGFLLPFLDRPPERPLFSPTESKLWHRSQERPERKTPVYPSELRRREQQQQARHRVLAIRHPNDSYTTDTYDQSITHGIKKANSTGIAVPHWTPNQLRHAISTELAETQGQQRAQRWLGHASLDTTAIYTEVQISELVEIARELDRRFEQTPALPQHPGH